MQHRRRDGRRVRLGNRGGWPIQRRMRHEFRDDFQETLSGKNAREDVLLVDLQFLEKQGEFVQENVDAIARN